MMVGSAFHAERLGRKSCVARNTCCLCIVSALLEAMLWTAVMPRLFERGAAIGHFGEGIYDERIGRWINNYNATTPANLNTSAESHFLDGIWVTTVRIRYLPELSSAAHKEIERKTSDQEDTIREALHKCFGSGINS
jgi:hypothetical protein